MCRLAGERTIAALPAVIRGTSSCLLLQHLPGLTNMLCSGNLIPACASRTKIWRPAADSHALACSPTHAVPKGGPLHLTLGKLHMALPLPISAEQLKLIPQVPLPTFIPSR